MNGFWSEEDRRALVRAEKLDEYLPCSPDVTGFTRSFPATNKGKKQCVE